MRRMAVFLLLSLLTLGASAWGDTGWAICGPSDTFLKWSGTAPTCASSTGTVCPSGKYIWIYNITTDNLDDCRIAGLTENDTLNTVFGRADGNKITNPTLTKPFRLGPDNGEHEDTYLDGGAFRRRRLNAVGTPVGVTTTVETGTTNTTAYGSISSPTTCETLTGEGVQTYANACKPMKTVFFPAIALEPDNNECGPFTTITLNGGPVQTMFSCVDSSTSRFFGSLSMLRTGWDGGPIQLTLHVYHPTTEPITFAGNFDAQCRAPGEAVSNTWSAAAAAWVAITTAHHTPRATTADITPAGTCAAGDNLWFRYTVDATNFSTNATNARVYGVTLSYRAAHRSGSD